MIGTSLSHYRITEKLGQGGMGEVYRARDTKLARDVAIKILPDAFAHDTDRVARFTREAQTLAALNHPNIAQIYGIIETPDLPEAGTEGVHVHALVMELVEGEDLSQRLTRGAVPLDQTLLIARQIIGALEAAHETGIVHRDLKPGNIKIRRDGTVKVLDFGLAKAMDPASGLGPDDLTNSPTPTAPATQAGVILGTAAYMAPEQARGIPADRRADIWAFGCILFECLTARKAFHADTLAETVAAVLKSEPDWALLPADTPPSVRAVLRQCLQKDPARRLRDIADVFVGIQDLAAPPSELVASLRRFSLWWTAGSVAVGIVATAFLTIELTKHFQVGSPPLVTRAIIRIERGQGLAGIARQLEFWRPSRTAMAMSSDGRFIVYSATEGNPDSTPRLYLRRTDQMEAKPIVGTEGGINPFLSPDDRWVGYWADDKLVKVSVEGGVPATLCDVSLLFGASWGHDNNIVFSPYTGGLFSVSADGGKPQALTAPDKSKEEYAHRLPHCLPGGKGVLFTIVREPWDSRPIAGILDLKTRRYQVLMEDAADARYAPTGHLVFMRRGTLMAVPFDINRLNLTGQPVPVVANVMQAISTNAGYNTCAGQFSISDSGWLTYVTGGVVPDLENILVWVDQRGTALPVASFKAPFIFPRLSPDGQRIAYATIGRESRLDVYDLTRGTVSPLTGEGKGLSSAWTADGKRLVYNSLKSGQPNLYWQPADGSSPMERLTASEYEQYPGSVTPDGTTLAFVESHSETGYDILLLDLQSLRVTPFLNSRSDEDYPAFSPDGRWLAYSSNESGRLEVYVRSFPSSGGKWELSLEGGTEPLWARNGRQLFYRSQDQVWAVDIRTDTGFTPGKPQLLFEKPGYRISTPIRCWDASPDGRRFLMVKLEEREPQPITEIILVQNWLEELKRLVPVK